MRLFIAFEIPEDIKQILIGLQDKIKFDGKATKVKQFHLTLKFLGEVEDSKVEQIVSGLSKIKFNRFDVSLSGIGVFPDRSYIRVAWVGLEPKETITELQKQIDATTEKLGFSQDNKFHPHLTLARIKFIKNKKELLGCLDNIKVPEASFPVSEFKLIKSTLTPQGPVYEVLSQFKAEQ
jgi:2'-5' RNA ligase